jgi:hypothetical protein
MSVKKNLKDFQYDYIINLTKYFLNVYKDGDIKSYEHIPKYVSKQVPGILNYGVKFDEEIWMPDRPEDYKNLMQFKYQLYGTLEILSFYLRVNDDYNQTETYNIDDKNDVKFDDIESSTGSKVGSSHWFRTIVSQHKHIGEFLMTKTPTDEILREWGKELYETSDELIKGHKLIKE